MAVFDKAYRSMVDFSLFQRKILDDKSISTFVFGQSLNMVIFKKERDVSSIKFSVQQLLTRLRE